MKTYIKKAIDPIRIFLNDSRSTGVILLACTAISLIAANSTIGNSYRGFWDKELLHTTFLPESPVKWINDFLMSFFFLFAGMEIKRELLNGELSTFKRAILPFGAALGGMIVPALFFLLFNLTSGHSNGWGIPTATDIAFSLGVASLFGKRIPVSLKILLMALAIIDDLGAIVVIAVFYGNQIHGLYLIAAAIIYGLLWACNYFKVKFGAVQIILGGLLWFSILNSGIEAGIAGVLVATALPLEMLPIFEKAIHGAVNFFILPLFALANTAIILPSNIMESIESPVGLGVMMGLVFGKPIGIFLFSRLLVALKIAQLPSKIKWKHILGMGALAGIGFTMSIFTTALAFTNESLKDVSKIAILAAMVLSLLISWVYFLMIEPKKNIEAENSFATSEEIPVAIQ
jgi:NhaA family Na+:H+ antiporter